MKMNSEMLLFSYLPTNRYKIIKKKPKTTTNDIIKMSKPVPLMFYYYYYYLLFHYPILLKSKSLRGIFVQNSFLMGSNLRPEFFFNGSCLAAKCFR